MGAIRSSGSAAELQGDLCTHEEHMLTLGEWQIVPAAIGEYLVFGSHFDTLSTVGSAIVTSAGAYAIVSLTDTTLISFHISLHCYRSSYPPPRPSSAAETFASGAVGVSASRDWR